MATIPSTALGQLVLERPALSHLLDRMGIDYCCGGSRTLAEACVRLGLDLDEVCRQVDSVDGGDDDVDLQAISLADLIDHIVDVHHSYLCRELPRLRGLLAQVAQAHGDSRGELWEIAQVYVAFERELTQHMAKEEQILFPAIRRIESGELAATAYGSLFDPIWVMENEHRRAGEGLARMRWLTGGYAAPRNGCSAYTALMNGLSELEADLHIHIHKENNILFPRAAQLQQSDSLSV